jgi:hypothetical protein
MTLMLIGIRCIKSVPKNRNDNPKNRVEMKIKTIKSILGFIIATLLFSMPIISSADDIKCSDSWGSAPKIGFQYACLYVEGGKTYIIFELIDGSILKQEVIKDKKSTSKKTIYRQVDDPTGDYYIIENRWFKFYDEMGYIDMMKRINKGGIK